MGKVDHLPDHFYVFYLAAYSKFHSFIYTRGVGMAATSCLASLHYMPCRWYRSCDQIIMSIIHKRGFPTNFLATITFGCTHTVQLDLNLSKNRVWCCTHTQYVQFQSRLALRVHAKLLTRILLAGTSRVSTRVPDVSSRACIIEYLERMQHESTCARELSL